MDAREPIGWRIHGWSRIAAADDNHKALVEALKEMRSYAREAVQAAGCGFTGWDAAEQRATKALAAFQSRQEEK